MQQAIASSKSEPVVLAGYRGLTCVHVDTGETIWASERSIDAALCTATHVWCFFDKRLVVAISLDDGTVCHTVELAGRDDILDPDLIMDGDTLRVIDHHRNQQMAGHFGRTGEA